MNFLMLFTSKLLRFYADIPRYSLHALLRLIYGKNWWEKVFQRELLYSRLNKLKYALRDNILLHVRLLNDRLVIRITPEFIIVCDYLDIENLNTIKSDLINIFYDEVYTRYMKISRSDIVVDVGAHIGIFTLYAAKRGKMVVAIEPEPRNYKWLRINTHLNNVRNVTPLNIALSDFNGEAYLYTSSISTEHTLVPEMATKTKDITGLVRVSVKKLDSILNNRINDSDELFVKIDVEGAELNVLRGFSLSNPIKFSITAYHYPDEYRLVYRYLRERGFNVVVKWWGEEPYVYTWRQPKR